MYEFVYVCDWQIEFGFFVVGVYFGVVVFVMVQVYVQLQFVVVEQFWLMLQCFYIVQGNGYVECEGGFVFGLWCEVWGEQYMFG